eukprot:TRINITY_DN196_c0_g1_i1.p1 TRINITY_DN196_c0_g1~~TRINITY_DN196_c0_g1_i1.p1  ORF type:complete len:356 (-),score=62.30 TRINITY_DN196_c0_g1_i1:66-1076(-)
MSNLRREKPLVSLDFVFNVWTVKFSKPQEPHDVNHSGVSDHLVTNFRFLDCTWNLTSTEQASRDFQAEHIPHALWFDIDSISQKDTDLPHMLPSDETFQEEMKRLGITNDSIIFLYDRPPFPSAARVWWTFKAFGHDQVYIMNGGLTQWKLKNYPTTSSEKEASLNSSIPQDIPLFKIHRREKMVYTYDQVLQNIVEQKDNPNRPLLIDARSKERYAGTAPEPRPGTPSGHIPGTHNLPFFNLFDMKTGLYHPVETIDAQLQTVLGSHPDSQRPIILSCGSGITACVLAVGLAECGYFNNYDYPSDLERDNERRGFFNISLYDGSWTEFITKQTAK